MGFSSGIPLLLVGQTLKAFMTDGGIDLATIGFFSFVRLPWAWKFLWAPFMDRYTILPLGRRRGWLLAIQIALALTIGGLGMINPQTDLMLLATCAFLVTFFSASQDIVVDAYRRERLEESQFGVGSALYVSGYRIAILVAGGLALYLADILSWKVSYWLMAASIGVGILTTLLCAEPKVETAPPKSLLNAYVGAFSDFFKRSNAWWVLAFILLYKVGESMASDLLTPFYMKIGFSKTEIFGVAKLVGLWATIVGGIVGGIFMVRLQTYRSLIVFGFLQTIALFLFSVLAVIGHDLIWLGIAVGGEMFTSAMATTAFLAYLFQQTNKKYTATQYALMSSAFANTNIVFGAATGFMAESLGWELYFVGCAVVTLPALLLLITQRKKLEPVLIAN